MASPDGGQVVTFYSCTGGTGRSMALANTAWILASSGLRVLAVDWDLESPGLYRYFHPFFSEPAIGATQGIVDLLYDYRRADRAAQAAGTPRSDDWYAKHASVLRHAFSLTWDKFPEHGTLDYLSAGQASYQYRPAYWEDFYQKVDGLRFIGALRADMRRNYDYVLIDSQTGLNDTASICVDIIPDAVVACFVLSDHSIDITAQFATAVRDQAERGRRRIKVLPVPMKIDLTESNRAEAGRLTARAAFPGFPNGLDDEAQAEYWARAGIPYWSSAAFEETLAVFEDRYDPPALLRAYEWLAAAITNGQVTALPPMDEQTRVRFRGAFTRRLPPSAGPGKGGGA